MEDRARNDEKYLVKSGGALGNNYEGGGRKATK